ncbi:MAG: substrate-binding domain-containing protein [Dysgonamonadaceae bacterium]|jgi:phosphate transport system substrate-binding protein|nr:substrate-binding domain-containing protein [Dysgonamonadaceae bacterium]
MKRFNLVLTIFLFVFFACAKEEINADNGSKTIAGITTENYPHVDGSTSTKPVNALIACKLLGLPYLWIPGIVGEWSVWFDYDQIPSSEAQQWGDFFHERIKVSQTHGAFMNLIDGNAEIILTHRTISPDEQAHAAEVGVTLIETSVAQDGFVFVVNKDNPVQSLTVQQVQDIYTGRITNWQQVGGNNETIKPYVRPRNSGSEEIMRSLVMEGRETADLSEIKQIASMAGVFPEIIHEPNSMCYTFNYYKEMQVRVPDEQVPRIAINGIFPDETSIRNRTYPFIAEVHVAIRSDLDRNSMAYKMYEWLQTDAGKAVIAESGYLPLEIPGSGTKAITSPGIKIYPHSVTDGFYITGLVHPAQLTLMDASGRLVLSKQVIDNEYVHANFLQKGIYIVGLLTGKDKIRVKIMKK